MFSDSFLTMLPKVVNEDVVAEQNTQERKKASKKSNHETSPSLNFIICPVLSQESATDTDTSLLVLSDIALLQQTNCQSDINRRIDLFKINST